jgi:RHS repeat-associated protein
VTDRKPTTKPDRATCAIGDWNQGVTDMRNETLGRETRRATGRTAWLNAGLAALGLALGLPAQAQLPANPYSYSRSVAYTYDAAGRVLTETVEPDNPALCVLTTYGYDAYGNKNSTVVANCSGTIPARQQFASRTAGADYAPATPPTVTINGVSYALPKGQFLLSATNALGHTSSFEYDPRFGIVTKSTDANGKVSTTTVDDFGRKTRVTGVEGTSTVYRYCYIVGRVSDLSSNTAGCDSGVPAAAPADAVSYVHSEPHDTNDAKMGPYSRVYVDRLGREIRSVTESFDGASQPAGLVASLIVKDTVYSAQGSKLMETQPYFLASGSSTASGSQDVGVTLTRYDATGRPTVLFTADSNGLGGSYSFNRDSGGFGYANYGSRTISSTRYNYAGLSTTLINDKGQQRLDEKNALGLLVRVTDEAGGQLAHQYDAFNNLLASKDALQNLVTLAYDIRGRKVQLNDPDSGLWKYDYDPLGQLVWQENPNQRAAGTAITMVYDKLGRMTSRSEPEGTGSWSYDTALSSKHGCFKGLLCASSYTRAGTADTRTNYTGYDPYYRVFNTLSTVTNGPSMAGYLLFDNVTGRLQYKTYPTGVQVSYGYTGKGFLQQLSLANAATVSPLPATAGGTPGASVNLPAGSSLWQAGIVSAWGKAEQSTRGNGVISRASYEAATGRTTALNAGTGASKGVLDYAYAWDSLNNLIYRADNIGDAVAGAVTENFEYGDALARLTKYTVNAPGVPGGSRTVTLQYNALGMLLSKSDVGTYTYPSAGSTRPHALGTLNALDGTSTSYQYDAAGNLTAASDGKYRGVTYTSFNLPDSQSGIVGAPGGAYGGTAQHTWVYDESHTRIKEVRTITGGAQAGTRTLWYLHPDNAGGLGFESEVNSPTSPSASNPAQTTNRHFLSVGGQAIGVLITNGSLPTLTVNQLPPNLATATIQRLEYWHQDHLGSLVATTDHTGAVTQRYAYDPFGKRRQLNGSYDAFGAIVIDWGEATNAGTNRGYTGHEHLDDIGLVHMNGRIFSPLMGLFLQPDQRVQEPKNLQNYNRYTYCWNNPLTCSDPTGMESVAAKAQVASGGAATYKPYVLPASWANSTDPQLRAAFALAASLNQANANGANLDIASIISASMSRSAGGPIQSWAPDVGGVIRNQNQLSEDDKSPIIGSMNVTLPEFDAGQVATDAANQTTDQAGTSSDKGLQLQLGASATLCCEMFADNKILIKYPDGTYRVVNGASLAATLTFDLKSGTIALSYTGYALSGVGSYAGLGLQIGGTYDTPPTTGSNRFMTGEAAAAIFASFGAVVSRSFSDDGTPGPLSAMGAATNKMPGIAAGMYGAYGTGTQENIVLGNAYNSIKTNLINPAITSYYYLKSVLTSPPGAIPPTVVVPPN